MYYCYIIIVNLNTLTVLWNLSSLLWTDQEFIRYHDALLSRTPYKLLRFKCRLKCCGRGLLFWAHNSTQYQFVMPSSDTATLKVTSHVRNFSPHPRWFLCSRWGLNLFQISFLHKTWCFSMLPGCTQMAQWEEAIQMRSALKTRLQMASQIWDLPAFQSSLQIWHVLQAYH